MHPDSINASLSLAERFAALSRVGAALMKEGDEGRLLHLIAQTACDLTGARFAAFSMRPVDEHGHFLVPAEGNLFHLAAVVGVTQEQEAVLQRMPLGGEGLLAPIFHHGISVLVSDVTALTTPEAYASEAERRQGIQARAVSYAQGQLPATELRSLGLPGGHPLVRSFLGAPLLDSEKQVRGGLLLGHTEPNRFTLEDEAVLVGLAAQAAVALESARLYRSVHMQAQELSAIFEGIADGVTLVDKQGVIRRENKTAHALREQLAQGHEEQLLDLLLHHPAQAALRAEAVQEESVAVKTKQGELKHYLVSASPLYTPSPTSSLGSAKGEQRSDSTISGAVVVWHDVTERHMREAERVAREHATYLEAILHAIPDGVFVYDKHGQIVQTNTAAHELQKQFFDHTRTIYSPRERFAHLTMTDEEETAFSFEGWPIARVLAGETLPPDRAIEMAVQTHDEQVLHISVTGGPLHAVGGNLSGAVIVTHDVTERRRLEQVEREAHAEAEKRLALLQLILDELPSSVYLVRGRDAQLILANRAAKGVWGAEWPHGQPFATFLQEQGIRIFATDGQPLNLADLATIQVIQHGKTVLQHQETIRHADGTSLPVLVNAVALRVHELPIPTSSISPSPTEQSEPAALVVHQDVTALKEAEQLKDEFIGLAAHELRTPLAILKGFSQMLLVQTARGKGPELAEWQTEALQGIDQATARMVELTEDLLDVTRLQAGQLELHTVTLDLVPLLQRLIARLRLTAENHQFSLKSERAHCVVDVDPRRIEQIFSNLIGNAIKYSPAGGSIQVFLRQDEQEHSIVISICDQGIGIPAQQQARIFGRFARADNTYAYGIGGTGLGLYLCRELVERHGGQIWFESEEGKGSTFFVRLPLHITEVD